MARFMYLYRGRAAEIDTPEQVTERAAAFAAWIARAGAALVDGGSPFGQGGYVCDDGTEGPVSGLIGYRIVEEGSLAAAKVLTEGLPFLASGNGACTVEIHELMSM